jgi:hypothetical protein
VGIIRGFVYARCLQSQDVVDYEVQSFGIVTETLAEGLECEDKNVELAEGETKVKGEGVVGGHEFR